MAGTENTVGRYIARATRRMSGAIRGQQLSIMDTYSWQEWQHAVVTLIRRDFSEVLMEIGADDVDWEAWRPLYEQGLTPGQAVAEAFLLPAA